MTRLVAGVDSSTQSCKVELRNVDTGELIASGSAPHTPVAPPCSEQNPDDWWTAFTTAFAAAKAKAGAADIIVGLSIAGQCHGLVCLDRAHRVVRPAKLWNDTTSTPELLELRHQIGEAELITRTGSLPTAAFTLSKIAWLARHEPNNFASVAHILLPHDYLTFRLTGRMVTDRSEASGTGYFDSTTGEYLLQHLALIDGSRDWLSMLPVVLPPEGVAGPVQTSVATQLGIDPSALVAAGGGDQHAAALGLGIVPGDVVYSLGTSGVVLTVSPEPVNDPSGAVDGVADMTGGYLPLVSTLNAAKVTDTFARLLGVDLAGLSDLALAADESEPGPTLVAYLDGERTPNRPDARGVLSNLTTATTREQVARAAFEGVILGLVQGQRHLERCGFTLTGRVFAVGGGSRSPAYVQLLADALRQPVWLPTDVPEATARGAAVQAAAMVNGELVATIRTRWRPSSTIGAHPRATRRTPLPDYLAAAACDDSAGAFVLNGWHRNHGTGSIAGSVYAVVPGARSRAARSLHTARCWVHADIIIDSVGAERGVTSSELAQIRRDGPDAQVDVHVIVLGDGLNPVALEVARAVLSALPAVRPQRLTLSAALIAALAAEVDAVRAHGTALWLQVDAAAEASVVADQPAKPDGVLVMLIEPGGTAAADPQGLDAVGRFAGILPVGVDGGVTSAVAASAVSRGASYIVSGRDLFFSPHESNPYQRED